jgi:hypothetical protein
MRVKGQMTVLPSGAGTKRSGIFDKMEEGASPPVRVSISTTALAV